MRSRAERFSSTDLKFVIERGGSRPDSTALASWFVSVGDAVTVLVAADLRVDDSTSL